MLGIILHLLKKLYPGGTVSGGEQLNHTRHNLDLILVIVFQPLSNLKQWLQYGYSSVAELKGIKESCEDFSSAEWLWKRVKVFVQCRQAILTLGRLHHLTAAALHNSIIISTPASQTAYYTEPFCTDIEQKMKLFGIAQQSWQRCSANEAHSDNEEGKIVTFADQKTIDCTNANGIEIIALAGSGFTIVIVRSCTSGSSTAKVMLIVAFGAYGDMESLGNSARKMISAHPILVNGKYTTYNEKAHCGTLYWWYRACLSLDCIKQSSTFCSQDHYRLYQKLTFYNSAIGIPPPLISGPDGLALVSPVEHSMCTMGMEYKRQSHTSQALIHMLIIVCICLTFAKEVQQSSNEPVAESALPSHHFQFRNALEVVARLSLQMECVPNQLATENPSAMDHEVLKEMEKALGENKTLEKLTLSDDFGFHDMRDGIGTLPNEFYHHLVYGILLNTSLSEVDLNFESIWLCPSDVPADIHGSVQYVTLWHVPVDVLSRLFLWFSQAKHLECHLIDLPLECQVRDVKFTKVEKTLSGMGRLEKLVLGIDEYVGTKYSEVSQETTPDGRHSQLVLCLPERQLPQESAALSRNCPPDELYWSIVSTDYAKPKHSALEVHDADIEGEWAEANQNLKSNKEFLTENEETISIPSPATPESPSPLSDAVPVTAVLISRSDVVRVQKSPELISKPYEVPVLRRGGLEETSTLLAVLGEFQQADLITSEECKKLQVRYNSWRYDITDVVDVQKDKSPEAVSKTAEVLKRHGFEKESTPLAVLGELQQADLITNEECKMLQRRYDISDVVDVQKGKSPEVMSRTAEVLRRHGFDEQSILLAVLGELRQADLITSEECKRLQVRYDWLQRYGISYVVDVQKGKSPEVMSKTAEVLRRHGFEKKSRLLGVLGELQQADLITSEECKRLSVRYYISNVVDVQKGKSPEVMFKTAKVLRRHGFDEQSRLLAGCLPRLHDLVSEEWSRLFAVYRRLKKSVGAVVKCLPTQSRHLFRRDFKAVSLLDARDLHRQIEALHDPELLQQLSCYEEDYLKPFIVNFLDWCRETGVQIDSSQPDVRLSPSTPAGQILGFILSRKDYYITDLHVDREYFSSWDVDTHPTAQAPPYLKPAEFRLHLQDLYALYDALFDEVETNLETLSQDRHCELRRVFQYQVPFPHWDACDHLHRTPLFVPLCTTLLRKVVQFLVSHNADNLSSKLRDYEKRLATFVKHFLLACHQEGVIAPTGDVSLDEDECDQNDPTHLLAYLLTLKPYYVGSLCIDESLFTLQIEGSLQDERREENGWVDSSPFEPTPCTSENEISSDIPVATTTSGLFVPPQPKEKGKCRVDTFTSTVSYKLSAPGEDTNGEDVGEDTTAERKQVGNHMTSHITTPTEDGVVYPQGDRSNALPQCPEPAISNHPGVEAAYQNVGVCPPPWPPPVSVQFQESGVAGLAQPASDTATTYFAELRPQYDFLLQPLLHCYTCPPFVAAPSVSCYYLVPAQSAEDVHPSLPSTVVLETACSLQSDAKSLGITEQSEADDEVFPTQESFGARSAQFVAAVIPSLPGEAPVNKVDSSILQQCLCKNSKLLPLTTFPPHNIRRKEIVSKEEFPFQLISETYEVVTGKGEFLFQQFLERENGELVFPEVHPFLEAGHQSTQLPATHYSTSRSHPTSGSFANYLTDWRGQGKGDDCAPQGAHAAPASGKGFLDCTGVSKTEKKLVFATFKGSDVENDGAITTCLPETRPGAEQYPFPKDTQPQYKPQEDASNHQREKLPKCSKKSKPPNENVDISDTNEPRRATDRNCVATTTLTRKETGANTDDTYVPEKPPILKIATQREQLTAEGSPVAVNRPGKEAGAVAKKSKAEPRHPNEPHTAIVGSATAPPSGRREAPVGREESVNVLGVRAASHQPAQASDQGYGTGTGTSSKNRPGTGVSNVDDVDYVDVSKGAEVATRSQCSAEPTFAHKSVADAYKDEQYCMAHISLSPQPNTVHRSELINGKIKRVSPMLKVLKECPNPRKHFDPNKFLEALQLDSLLPRKEVDTALYVTNRAKLEQMYPYLIEGQKERDTVAAVVYSTLKYTVSEEEEARAVRDKFTDKLRIGWNALKDCLAIRYVNVERLAQKLLPRESMAEWTKKKDNWQGIVEELRYFLKLKAERQLTRPRVVHALLVTGGDAEFINDVLSAGESLSGDNPTLPEIQEFLSSIQEPLVFDKVFTEIVESLKVAGEWGVANELQERGATKSNPMHLFGVWLATAATTTRPATWADFVQLLRMGGVDEGVVQTVPGGPWDSHQSDVFHTSVGQQPPVTAQAVQELSSKQVDQPRVWNERMVASANERNKDIEDVDGKHSARSSADQQSSDSADKSKFYVGPSSSSNVDARSQGVGVPSQNGSAARRPPSQAPRTNQPIPRITAATTLSNREEEEERYLSLPLDPGDVKSILYHAKAVYLTLDYNNTRRILDILAHHLLIDEELLRAKVFGYAISFYRQRNFPPALERLDELEKLALEHHSAGDVSLSCIYRGEIYMAQKKLDQAFRMFDHARATYDENNVSTYYGIIILSKCAVMVKAANCQKQLMDYRKAKEVYHMAIEFAERVRLTKEALPLDEPDRKNKVEAAYRDEITARCSLGNLFQNMSDCANALEQYEVVLHLQGKIDGDRAALGWAEGNYGNALLGLNRLKESIPHLQRAFELARKHERGNQGISRAASNLGNALQAAKQYADAQNSFEIALGHSVFSGDEVGHARALGNLGNVKLVKGEPLEALRYYNEALSLNSDDTSLYTAYQNRASVYITLAAKVNEGVGEWDEVPEDIVAEKPREAISIQLPVEEQTKEVENFHRQHMVLPSGRTLPRGGLDDSEEYFKGKDGSPSQSEVLSGAGGSVPSAGGPPPQQGSSTRLGTSHTHYLRYRKFYLRKAEEDLLKVVEFVEDRFTKVKGKEDTNSLALSIFEANSKAFYGLQKVLVCLGRSQEALKYAEANRARNLGEVMLSAKKNTVFSLSNIKVPLDLSTIWSFANSEQTPVAVLSCDVSCILVHIIVPRDEQSSLVPVMGYGRQQTFPSSLMRGGEEAIPANCYHFFKIELFTDTFTDEWSRNREARPSSDNVTFEQYVTKNLMDFLNAKETNLFEPVDFEPRDNPLTVLFDQFARKFAEVIEATAPEFHELVVIADQALHLLPWPVLQDKTSRKFLGDRYRIRTYPSILTMGVISSQPDPVITLPSEERFLVVGNPAIPKFINQKKEVSLGRLPHAEDEATQVSHILETKPLLREQATKQTVIYRLQMANLVHIATHGSGSQGYIALASNMPVLSSNNAAAVDAKECLLFIDEIQRLHIGAALVVLSACDSARGEIVNEGVNSVARAILAAGAQSVLVSLVRVPDKSASIFMRLFYRFLAHDGMTTSEALQKSSMGVRCIKSLSQHVHWGGFQLIGRNIKIKYNNESNSAKVATLVGDPTPFPRLELLQQLEKAIFRKDRTPPRDVVLVKGLSFNDPAEVVRDFICKHFKHYPGGVFWYNAASEDLLDASVSFVKQTVPHLKTIQREPPVEKAILDKKKKTFLDGSGGESYDNHYRLIVLDHPASMAACLAKIPEIHSSHSDVIVIHTADTDRDQSLTRWVDEQLVRGCTPIVAGHLDKYDSIQRMAYSILRDSHITPYEEDYEAFDVLQQFCHGSSSLVRMLEGMLCREEPEMELRQLASDLTLMQDMEPDVFTGPGQQNHPQTHPAAEKKTSFFKRSGKSKDRARGCGTTRNGCIHETPELSADDLVHLSNGHEKPARLFFPIGTLLETRMTQEEHFLVIALGYLTLYPKAHSEGTLTFTDQFLTQLATVITEGNGRTTEPHFLVNNLAKRHVIRQYPLPVLSPPDYENTFKLFYIPDSIVRAVTFDLDKGDEAFILTACSSAVQHLSELHSYHSALKKKVKLLFAESGLPSLQQWI